MTIPDKMATMIECIFFIKIIYYGDQADTTELLLVTQRCMHKIVRIEQLTVVP